MGIYFTDEASDWLQENIKKHESLYRDEGTDWSIILNEQFGDGKWYKNDNNDSDKTFEYIMDKRPLVFERYDARVDRTKSDMCAFTIYNAVDLHLADFGKKPNQLTAFYNHILLHPYITYRWYKVNDIKEHIMQHYFRSATIQMDCMGRLWYMAFLAHGVHESTSGIVNQNDILKFFANNAQFFHHVCDYRIMQNPHILGAFLVGYGNLKERQLTDAGFQRACQIANEMAGGRILDAVPDLNLDVIFKQVKRHPEYVSAREYMIPDKNPLRVLSLGAGVQSTVLALMSDIGYDGMEKPDFAVFADTGWEPPSVYEHLDWLESQLSYPIHRVSAGNIRENLLNHVMPDGSSFLGIPFHLRETKTNKKAGMYRRQCTSHYKIKPIQKLVKEKLGITNGHQVPKDMGAEMLIGISTDEITRAKPSQTTWVKNVYPLIEKEMSRMQLIKWFSDRYPNRTLPRSACIGCPYKTNVEWKQMRDTDPASFKDAIHVDERLRVISDTTKYTPYVHLSRVPLAQADLDSVADYDDFITAECEGMCGV